MSTKLKMKSIADFEGYTFRIPSQQRGYKWRVSNVLDLVEDLLDFISPSTKSKVYSLQPLAIQVIDKEKNIYAVLDGQQRLTTMFLLNRVLTGKKLYEFDYERDSDNRERNNLLNSLSNVIDDTTIDSHYMSQAKVVLQSCFNNDNIDGLFHKEEKERIEKIRTCVQEADTKQRLQELILRKAESQEKEVDFIWYEINGNPHQIFRNLNSGKISLTNADLIKALLLDSEGALKGENLDKIALQLDEMQKLCKEDCFWHMLQPREYISSNTHIKTIEDLSEVKPSALCIQYRMDMIYNLALDVSLQDYINNPLASFYKLYRARKNKEEFQALWIKIRQTFLKLWDIYRHIQTYHYMGMLAYCYRNNKDYGYSWIKLVLKNREEKNASAFVSFLKDEIKKRVVANKIKDEKGESRNKKLCELDFEKDKEQIRRTLLLHNIETILYKYKIKADDTSMRLQAGFEHFPFDLLYRQGWDVEHLASQTDNPLTKNADKEDWIKSNKEIWEEQLNEKDKEYVDEAYKEYLADNAKFDALYTRVIERLEGKDPVINKDGIGNLVLLDKHTNRSFHNSLFPRKRHIIIVADNGNDVKEDNGNTDKKEDTKIVYIPLTTKQVFMKYYNKNISVNMSNWTQQDFDAYLGNMSEMLSYYYNN